MLKQNTLTFFSTRNEEACEDTPTYAKWLAERTLRRGTGKCGDRVGLESHVAWVEGLSGVRRMGKGEHGEGKGGRGLREGAGSRDLDEGNVTEGWEWPGRPILPPSCAWGAPGVGVGHEIGTVPPPPLNP